MTHICKEFIPYRKKSPPQIFCSTDCMYRARIKRENRICAHLNCNNTFNVKPSSKQKFCSLSCANLNKSKRVSVKCACLGCEKVFEIKRDQVKRSIHNFCSRSCKGLFYSNAEYVTFPAKSIILNAEIAYLLGLITSDGTLHKNRKLIKICSKDRQLLSDIRELICYNITGYRSSIQTEQKIMNGNQCIFHTYSFSSKLFYNFCVGIGLMPNKSLIVGALKIPDEFFNHFLRGLIDGDGNYNVHIANKTTLRKKIITSSLSP